MRHLKPLFARLQPLAFLLLAGATARAAGLDPAEVDFFENRVRPLLAERCYECHSARAESVRGGLRLDHRAGVTRGGTSGPLLVPGQPTESRLIQAVRGTNPDIEPMPPRKSGPPLSPAEIATLEEWVRRGAPDPRADPTAAAPGSGLHWAFVAPVSPAPPSLKNPAGVRTGLDAFIRARLESAGLAPAPPADRRTLLRRLTYDLTGLPP
ncbi:MAG: c-type cytochrome domain-containing protein, partial [Verrucomicrobiota bacterium]